MNYLNLLHSLSSLIIHVYIPGLYSNVINDAEITIPKKVSSKGEHLSHDLISFHDDGAVHFNVSLTNKEYFLILLPAKYFLGPGIVVERRKRDIHTRGKPKLKSTNCHFQGIVHGEPFSTVALSACNGLVS